MVDAPQDVQRYRWAPAFVFPLRFVLPPHAGYFTVFMVALSTILNGGFGGSDLRRQVGTGHIFLPITQEICYRYLQS